MAELFRRFLTLAVVFLSTKCLFAQETTTICRNGNDGAHVGTLTCDFGETLIVASAFYGRRANSGSICTFGDTGFECGTRDDPILTDYVRGLCSGRDVCQLNARWSFPGHGGCDREWGVNTYLEVKYKCVTLDPVISDRWWMPGEVADGSLRVTWEEAYEACRKEDSHLVSIMSPEENEALKDFLVKEDDNANEDDNAMWIGANDKDREGFFKWSDGSGDFFTDTDENSETENMYFSNWATGEPNDFTSENAPNGEDGVSFYTGSGEWGESGEWNDDYKMRGYVCEQTPKYMLHHEPHTWQEARDICHMDHRDLVSIHSAEQDAEVREFVERFEIRNTQRFWIGGNVIEDEAGSNGEAFAWSDGSPFDYEGGWLDRQPDNDGGNQNCVEFRYDPTSAPASPRHGWADEVCRSDRRFICGPRLKWTVSDINEHKNWSDARDSCRFAGKRLATIASAQENADLYQYLQRVNSQDLSTGTWLGLSDQSDEGTFRWSDSSLKFDYNNFPNIDINTNGLDCVVMQEDGKWRTESCDTGFRYVCETLFEPHTDYYMSDDDQMSWDDAREVCRGEGRDLVSMHNEEENTELFEQSVFEDSGLENKSWWIGGRRESGSETNSQWDWSDGTGTFQGTTNVDPFAAWKSDQPNDGQGGEVCVFIVPNGGGVWSDGKCNENNYFACGPFIFPEPSFPTPTQAPSSEPTRAPTPSPLPTAPMTSTDVATSSLTLTSPMTPTDVTTSNPTPTAPTTPTDVTTSNSTPTDTPTPVAVGVVTVPIRTQGGDATPNSEGIATEGGAPIAAIVVPVVLLVCCFGGIGFYMRRLGKWLAASEVKKEPEYDRARDLATESVVRGEIQCVELSDTGSDSLDNDDNARSSAVVSPGAFIGHIRAVYTNSEHTEAEAPVPVEPQPSQHQHPSQHPQNSQHLYHSQHLPHIVTDGSSIPNGNTLNNNSAADGKHMTQRPPAGSSNARKKNGPDGSLMIQRPRVASSAMGVATQLDNNGNGRDLRSASASNAAAYQRKMDMIMGRRVDENTTRASAASRPSRIDTGASVAAPTMTFDTPPPTHAPVGTGLVSLPPKNNVTSPDAASTVAPCQFNNSEIHASGGSTAPIMTVSTMASDASDINAVSLREVYHHQNSAASTLSRLPRPKPKPSSLQRQKPKPSRLSDPMPKPSRPPQPKPKPPHLSEPKSKPLRLSEPLPTRQLASRSSNSYGAKRPPPPAGTLATRDIKNVTSDYVLPREPSPTDMTESNNWSTDPTYAHMSPHELSISGFLPQISFNVPATNLAPSTHFNSVLRSHRKKDSPEGAVKRSSDATVAPVTKGTFAPATKGTFTPATKATAAPATKGTVAPATEGKHARDASFHDMWPAPLFTEDSDNDEPTDSLAAELYDEVSQRNPPIVDANAYGEATHPKPTMVDPFPYDEATQRNPPIVDPNAYGEATHPKPPVVDPNVYGEPTHPKPPVVEPDAYGEATHPKPPVVDPYPYGEATHPKPPVVDPYPYGDATHPKPSMVDPFESGKVTHPKPSFVDPYPYGEATHPKPSIVDPYVSGEATHPKPPMVDPNAYDEAIYTKPPRVAYC